MILFVYAVFGLICGGFALMGRNEDDTILDMLTMFVFVVLLWWLVILVAIFSGRKK
jgi:hypothetical protein